MTICASFSLAYELGVALSRRSVMDLVRIGATRPTREWSSGNLAQRLLISVGGSIIRIRICYAGKSTATPPICVRKSTPPFHAAKKPCLAVKIVIW